MPHIEITTWTGKNEEIKRELEKGITDTVVSTLNIKPEMVSIIIREVPKENWAVGGKLDKDRDYT